MNKKKRHAAGGGKRSAKAKGGIGGGGGGSSAASAPRANDDAAATTASSSSDSPETSQSQPRGGRRERHGGLSPPQLTSLLCLSLGLSYVVQYGRAANEGLESNACAVYYLSSVDDDEGEVKCTESDLFFIRLKYYTSLVTLSLVSGVTFLIWSDRYLLNRFNSFLCVSPLLSTIVALCAARVAIKRGHLIKIGTYAVALSAVSFVSIRDVPMASRRVVRLTVLNDALLIVVAMAHSWEALSVSMGGADGILIEGEEGASVSEGAKALVPFLAVDKLTVFLVVFFGLLYLDDNRKRVMLLYLTLSSLAQVCFQLPHVRESLRGSDEMRTYLWGSAIFTGVLTVFPTLGKA